MQKLSRSKSVNFRVNDREYDMIKRRQKETGIGNMRAFLLKMALNGMIYNIELTSVNECARLLRNISGNNNQIAKKVNTTGNIYAADIDEIKARQEEIWGQQNTIVKLLTEIVEVA